MIYWRLKSPLWPNAFLDWLSMVPFTRLSPATTPPFPQECHPVKRAVVCDSFNASYVFPRRRLCAKCNRCTLHLRNIQKQVETCFGVTLQCHAI